MLGKYYQNDVTSSYQNNPKFMIAISINVSERLDRQLTKEEQIYIVDLIRKLDENYLNSKNQTDVIEELTNIIYKKLHIKKIYRPMDGAEYIDMHENLKQHIGTTSESNVSNSIFESVAHKTGKVEDIGRNPSNNPMGATRRSYFLLDSRYRNAGSTSNRFIWDYSNSKTQQTGSVNIIGDVRDIVAIRIYSFRAPIAKANTYHKRITVLIHEFASQSFFAHENRKFHFSLPYSIDGNFIEANPFEQKYKYYFEKPFTTLPSITVSFGNPLRLINLDNDSGKCTVDYIGIMPLTKITTQVPHGIDTDDLVFFSNFNASAGDAILKNTINRESGFIVTVIDPNNFSIDYNTSGILSPIVGLIFDVYYDSKRFYIPFELEYIKPDI